MITAHAPAGYITGKVLSNDPKIIRVAVLGGIFPDFDLVWFYLIDDRAFHHHHYLVHVPFFWLVCASVCFPLCFAYFSKQLRILSAFFAGVAVHIALDGIAGGIKWLWPLSNTLFYIVNVAPVYKNWILNFVLHQVFLLELLIWVAALVIYMRQRAGI